MNRPPKQRTAFGFQSRFLLGLACIFLCFCALASVLIYFHQKKTLEEETFRKTELVVAAVESIREYVGDVLRPKMYDILDDDNFIIEAMSTSYVSRVVMDRFKTNLPEFEYRRVAINARNTEYEANTLERKMIRFFNEKTVETQWHGIVKTELGRYYMSFRPVRFTTPCFHCHGDPQDAPQAIVENYGALHGFHKKPDVVSGLQSVAIPVDFGLKQIMNVAWNFFFVTFLIVFSLYGIIWFFFNKVVVQNLLQLLDIFRESLRDEKGVRLYQQAKSKDEIDEMTVAVYSVARHLHETHKRLEDYAENLENKVNDRTQALQLSESRLQQKVTERGLELRTLNTIAELIVQSVHLKDILPKVLRQTLNIIPARGAGIYLLDREQALLRLQCQENAEELKNTIPFEPSLCLPMLEEHSRDFDGFINEASLQKSLNVPLCCRNQVLGVMTFIDAGSAGVDAQQHELLFSIGHQIGVTIESLHNIGRLMQSKELLQSVFDGITDIVTLLDHERRVKMVNRAFLDRHDVTLEQVLNRPLTDIPLKQTCPFVFCITDLTQPSLSVTVEQIETEEGDIYEVTLYPILSKQGNVRNIVCYAKDITEQKKVEEKIQQTEKLVAVGHLAAGVAHEINNPLGVMLCYTDIIKENNKSNTEIIDDIEVVERHAKNCRRIVADLLDFAHSSGTQIDKQYTSINETVENVLDMVHQQFQKMEITLTSSLDDNLPGCLVDSRRMKQVFLNLIMNSIQATGRKGNISITTRAENNRILIEIKDDGPGINKDIQKKIFDPFFSTKEPGQGTGLGLSVSYGIVREHGGEIKIGSTVGHGAKFTVIIPASQEEKANE